MPNLFIHTGNCLHKQHNRYCNSSSPQPVNFKDSVFYVQTEVNFHLNQVSVGTFKILRITSQVINKLPNFFFFFFAITFVFRVSFNLYEMFRKIFLELKFEFTQLHFFLFNCDLIAKEWFHFYSFLLSFSFLSFSVTSKTYYKFGTPDPEN